MPALCDAHVHFFSHNFFSALAKQKGCAVSGLQPQLGWVLPGPDPEDLAAHWIAELDRNGVSEACLIASIPGDEASVLAAVRAYPGRFHGYALFDPKASDALSRAEEALGSGLQGICLFPAMHGYSVHDACAVSLMELAASKPGTVVFVHCGVLSIGVRKKLGLPSYFDMRYSNPIDLHAVALRFPTVPFLIPHFGAGYLREALMVCDLCPNVYLDTSSSNSWMRYEGLSLKDLFARALDVAGPQRLLFGSDSSFFPRGWHSSIYGQQARALEELGVGAEDRAAIFGGNFGRLLRKA